MQLNKTDDFGNHTIAVFGDSITHGANCPNIPGQSYIGLLKDHLARNHGLRNYGFASTEASMWNACGRYDEIHTIRQESPWHETREPENLGTYALIGEKAGLALTVTVSQPYRYAFLYYTAGPDGGQFKWTSGKRTLTVDTRESVIAPRRVGPLRLDNGLSRIETLHDEPVAISGFGYYNDLDGYVVNNYANNGLRLVGLNDEMIKIMARADTVIFSLGYNDSHFPTRKSAFTQKIDTLADAVLRYGTRLFVLDFCWNLPEDNHFRLQLRRLAQKTGAVAIEQLDMTGRLDGVGAHPDPDGHKMIADRLIKEMGL